MMETTFMMMALFTAEMGHAKPNIVFLFTDDLEADEINCTMDMVDTWPTPSGQSRC